MILSDLYRQIGHLVEKHGDCLVIDNHGNDINAVHAPLREVDEELPADDDARAVMLTCAIDIELRRAVNSRAALPTSGEAGERSDTQKVVDLPEVTG